MATYRAPWARWPLGVTAAVVLLLAVLSPWSGVRADELAVYRPAVPRTAAISGMVVGSLRAWRTAPGAWTAAIAVVLTTTSHSVLSMVLPRSSATAPAAWAWCWRPVSTL